MVQSFKNHTCYVPNNKTTINDIGSCCTLVFDRNEHQYRQCGSQIVQIGCLHKKNGKLFGYCHKHYKELCNDKKMYNRLSYCANEIAYQNGYLPLSFGKNKEPFFDILDKLKLPHDGYHISNNDYNNELDANDHEKALIEEIENKFESNDDDDINDISESSDEDIDNMSEVSDDEDSDYVSELNDDDEVGNTSDSDENVDADNMSEVSDDEDSDYMSELNDDEEVDISINR